MAIIRADNSEQLIDASRALIDGGVSGIEITMTTPNALQVIADVRREFGDKVLAGVGSVLDVKTAAAAIAAGAEYVITPVLKPEVIAYCNRRRQADLLRLLHANRGADLLRTRRRFHQDFSRRWSRAEIYFRSFAGRCRT